MLRCGQPLTTMGGKRSREDEKLVNATLPGNDLKGVIVDTRSQTAAMNSRAKGEGWFLLVVYYVVVQFHPWFEFYFPLF